MTTLYMLLVNIESNERLDSKLEETIKLTTEFLNANSDRDLLVSISGGKDSSVLNYIFKNYILDSLENKNFKYIAFNTTNDTAETYKQMYKEGLSKSNIINPMVTLTLVDDDGNKHRVKKTMGWYQWIEKVKNYWIPNALKRSCCSTFKEGQLKRVLDKDKEYISMVGVRKYESVKRAFYEFDMEQTYKNNKHTKTNTPQNCHTIAPICYWTDYDIWLYILRENISVNEMYYKGFYRCGCLICPYQSEYTDLLIKYYYPKQWERWTEILKKNYSIKAVEKRLKWSLNEYINGKWKIGVSKEYEIISKSKTKERIKELSDIKGISEEMAAKYWNKTCTCGKKLNPDEIAMFYKMFGRYENKEDNRLPLCKSCLCKELNLTQEEYADKVKYFRDQGCELF